MSVEKTAQDFLELLKEKEEIERHLKSLNKEIFKLEQNLYDEFESSSTDSIEIDGIKFEPQLKPTYQLAGNDNGAQKWDNKEEWFAWLKEIGEGGLIKTFESVPWNTRERFLRDWVEEGNNLPDFIQEKYMQNIKYNKSAVKRLIEC